MGGSAVVDENSSDQDVRTAAEMVIAEGSMKVGEHLCKLASCHEPNGELQTYAGFHCILHEKGENVSNGYPVVASPHAEVGDLDCHMAANSFWYPAWLTAPAFESVHAEALVSHGAALFLFVLGVPQLCRFVVVETSVRSSLMVNGRSGSDGCTYDRPAYGAQFWPLRWAVGMCDDAGCGNAW
jgi:hypothetical protein